MYFVFIYFSHHLKAIQMQNM